MIRAIIIDDEPSALSVLSSLLQQFCRHDVELVGTTLSPLEGKKMIEQLKPDLVFLDIEMPGMSGFDLVRSFDKPAFRVVFCTAYDAYAVEAFRLSALDYLLKPIGEEDVVNAVQKIKTNIQKNQNQLNTQLEQLTWILNHHKEGIEQKIAIGMADKIVFISVSDIVYCEANSNYTHVYLKDGEKLVSSKTLGEFEAQLGVNQFLRIHHHYLINLGRVKEFQKQDGGYVIMENGKELEVSQRKRKDFLDAIQNIII